MFGWLKDKAAKVSNRDAAAALLAEFRPLNETPGAPRDLADQLVNYVLKGDGGSVIAKVASLKNTHLQIPLVSTRHQELKQKGLPRLLPHLPPDPEVLFRLAKVYDAVQTAGAQVSYTFDAPTIPAFQGSLSWLGFFLIELSREGKEKEPIFPLGLLMAMIEAGGENPNVLIRGAFFYEDAQGRSQLDRWMGPGFACFHCIDQFPELVVSLPDLVRPAFQQKEAISRASALRALNALRIAVDPFVEEIASLAVSGSKEVRECAAPLLTDNFAKFTESLKRFAEKGSADQRFHAVRLLARLGGDAECEFLTRRLNSEKSDKICAAIREAVSDATAAQTAQPDEAYQFPEIPEVPVHAPLDKKYREELREVVMGVEDATAIQFAQNQYGWTRTPVTPDAPDRLFDALQNYVVGDPGVERFFADSSGVNATLLQYYQIPSHFQLIHVIRWCLLLSADGPDQSGKLDAWQLGYTWSRPLQNFLKNQKKPINLRELAAVFRTLKLDERAIGQALLYQNEYMTSHFLAADTESVWQFFAERLYLLEEAMGLKPVEDDNKTYWNQQQRPNAFAILKLFPRLPARFVQPFWEIALSGSKSERVLAQELLEKVPHKIIAALESRQQETRIAAAQWLTRLNCKDAIPALRNALAKEKSDGVREELIKSLELLGVPLDELLDVDKLDQEAEKGLKKGMPKDLDWFPFAQMPAVVWDDSGKPVPETILQWFILQGYKLKNAEASPTLRQYCSLFRKDERERFGKFVLEAWIAQDTKPKYTADQAAAEARKVAQQTAAMAKQYPQYYTDFNEQRVYQTTFNWYVMQPEASETRTKGILAVAGACCGADAAPIVHRYVKQWYGMRAAQCKALLQVLAWIDHPSATQVVLSVANRFRTKGIQEEALRLCQFLAERKGWTMDDLADRTIPTVGLDETGAMELDYGSRTFTATLSDEMAITLTNQNGKVIASLPDANQSDDPEKVKQAKSALSSARKELKSILTMQRDRLYEGLCTQRSWRFEDWDTYLRPHPIIGRYCQRLVWVAYDNERVVESFRPLPDGTLTNHEDDEVKLEPDTPIRLGHDETLPVADRKAWLQHFSDYEVEPLFQQFGKPQVELADEMKQATEITDFLGHIVKAFSLRTRLTKLGYVRGATQDGGWFYDYRKTFISLGLEAIVEFTGNYLPEENRTVALQRLYFTRKTDHNQMAPGEIQLGSLPPVLITECWNDIRMAAAAGPGFAEDWEKQTEV